jgi:hypothetical protein
MSSFEQERILQSDARVALEKFRDLSNENDDRQLSTKPRAPPLILQINNFVEISDGIGEHDCSAAPLTRHVSHSRRASAVRESRAPLHRDDLSGFTTRRREHKALRSPLRPWSSQGIDLVKHSSAISAVVVVVNQPSHATSEPVSPIMAAEGDF